MKTDTDKKAFFENLIAASNCNDEDRIFKTVFSSYIFPGKIDDDYKNSARFAVDLIDYLNEQHEDALTALVVARRILNQLSK